MPSSGKRRSFADTFNIALLSLPPITVDGGILVTELGHTTKKTDSNWKFFCSFTIAFVQRFFVKQSP